MNKFLELAQERKEAAFAMLNSKRVMSRDRGSISDLVDRVVTFDSVEIHKSKETGEPFVVFTIEEDVDHFFFASKSLKEDVIYASEKGMEIKELSGVKMKITKKPYLDSFIYKVEYI